MNIHSHILIHTHSHKHTQTHIHTQTYTNANKNKITHKHGLRKCEIHISLWLDAHNMCTVECGCSMERLNGINGHIQRDHPPSIQVVRESIGFETFGFFSACVRTRKQFQVFFLLHCLEIFVFRVSQMYSWHCLQTRVLTSPALTQVGWPWLRFLFAGNG